ncbi:MAG: cation diffusion facilitator family transporter [Halanaerobiaceae bacterium]
MRSEETDSQKIKQYKKAIFIAIGGNVFLTIIKGLLAWISGSSAVFSDAANSLSDTLYSVIMGIGLYVSQKPADETHPQGHRQFEPLVSLFIAGAMGTAGVAAVWQSVQHFLGKTASISIGWPTFVLSLAVIVKYIMYYFVKKIGNNVHSPAIKASARDNLADIITSLSALIGVWGAHYIHPYFDPVAGFLVALWIFKATAEIAWENIGYLTGRGASLELTNRIADLASAVSAVDDVHQIVAEYVGPQLRIDMHINVDGKTTLDCAHDISEDVREVIEELEEVDLVFVHVEPTVKKD